MKPFSIAVFAFTLWLNILTFERFHPAGYLDGLKQSFTLGTNYNFNASILKFGELKTKLEGKVDVYPFAGATIMASGMDYFPRPCLQSYEAYSPYLSELDAAHLRGQYAPDYVYFDIEAGPDYPSLDDGLSWPELLTRYEPVGGDFYLILRKSFIPRNFEKVLYSEGDIGFNQTIPLNAGLVWAEIDVEKSAYGQLVGQIYKDPIINIAISVGSKQPMLRLVPGSAKAGFLISPFVPDAKTFYRLYNYQDWIRENQVLAFALTVSGDSACYKPKVHVKLYQLQLK